MEKRDIFLIIMLLCCVLLCACNCSRGREELLSDDGVKKDIIEESADTDRAEKDYDLPVSDSEREEAEDDCKEKMKLIAERVKVKI